MTPIELLTHIERNCSRLAGLISSMSIDWRDKLIVEILDTPSPKTAALRVDDLLAEDQISNIREILTNESIRSPLLASLAGSSFLFFTMQRHPELIREMFLNDGYLLGKTRAEHENDLGMKIAAVTQTPELDHVLRFYKEQEYLRVGCRDLVGIADCREIMAELSDLACACTQMAVDFHFRALVIKYGVPQQLNEGNGFAVLGLGKVSGRELNFSSDVDMMFIRGLDEGMTAGPAPIPVKQFYETLAQRVTRSLSDITEDGFVFRIDLRLRPEGEKGELVPSFNNALEYYLGWGRTWERAALMKAVPIAGDMKLGRDFVEELEPFIYRKHLDYSTLEEMRLMKLRIETKLKRKPGINLKLGQGGIREIEFFAQALQLINAGRIRRVRTSSTLEALSLLGETGLLETTISRDLIEAYLFFRKTEHRIQMNYQLQTHELPRTVEEQAELARRMGYRQDPLKTFLEDLDARRRLVEELFTSMFYHSGDEIIQQVSPLAKTIMESIHDQARVVSLLAGQGFESPEQSYNMLKNLAQPSGRKNMTDKGRQLLERLAPLFVEELLKVPEPGKAIMALDSYIDSLHSSSAYFSTFMENPTIVRLLVKILGESRFFAELLLRHPQAIDSLIATGARSRSNSKEFMELEITERLALCEDFESELDVLRRFKNEEMLVIGVRHLWGETDAQTARRLISALAEVCLEASVRIATKEMIRKFGPESCPDQLPFVIVGMGKLGGQEMTYLSDIDVIFVYDHVCDTMGKLGTHEWYTRLASRIIAILSVPTSEGTVFAIDARLRPSGNKGPLVSSTRSFGDYHQSTAKLWEKQALTKARTVIGSPATANAVTTTINECLVRTEASDKDLQEIAHLRRRMEQELALEDKLHVDLKTGHGGLVDVEFFVQGNILRYAKTRPEIVLTNTLEAIAALRNVTLITEETFATLDSGYRFLTNLEDRLRLMENKSVDRMPLSGDKLKGLAMRLGYPNGREDAFLEDYFRVTRGIRSIYNSFFGIHEKGTRTN